MLYENELTRSIENNNLSEFKILVEEKDVDPFSFGMDNIELCIKNDRKNFIEFSLNFIDKYNFNPTLFLEKVNKKEYNPILFKLIKDYKEKIDYTHNSEMIIKNIIMNKNEDLLLYLIKERIAYPFLNENDIIINLLVENDMYQALKLIIKDINKNHSLLESATIGYSYNCYKLLNKHSKFKIDYKKLLKIYLYSNKKETEYSQGIVDDLILKISPSDAMDVLLQRSMYYYLNHTKEIMEKRKAFEVVLDYTLKDKENYSNLNKLFNKNSVENYTNNIIYLLSKSDLLIQEIKNLTFKDRIKIFFRKKENINYFYTHKDIFFLLRQEEANEDVLYEIFKDKNIEKFINVKKLIKEVKSQKLKNILNLSYNVNNF